MMTATTTKKAKASIFVWYREGGLVGDDDDDGGAWIYWFFLWIQKLCVYEGLKGNLNVQHRFGVLNNFQMIPRPLPARGTGATTACSRQTASQSVIQPKLPTNQTNKHAAIHSFSQPASQSANLPSNPTREKGCQSHMYMENSVKCNG